jgi:glycosyltransferase involved in cell wall biosynthesis
MEREGVSKGRLLLLSYYWPPAGGIGVQRWLSMSSHLCDLGWDIAVVHPKGADYPLQDPALLDKIDKRIRCVEVPVFEVRKLFALFLSKGKQRPSADELFYIEPGQRTLWQKISLWIRANVFIPDARVTWIKPLLMELDRMLRKESFDFVISTGPPHSVHLSAMQLKSKFPQLLWIADFRDPWTAIEYHHLMPMTAYSKREHLRLESEVLTKADAVLTVSPSWAQELSQIRGGSVECIPNGFEEKDFLNLSRANLDAFVFCHCGTFTADRWIPAFWRGLQVFLSQGIDPTSFSIALVGKVDGWVKEQVTQMGLDPWVNYKGELSHREALEQMVSSQVLYLPINQNEFNNRGRLTGKIYEYMAAKVPVLLQGPKNGDAYQLVASAGFGASFSYEETKEALQFLQSQWEAFKAGENTVEVGEVSAYSRRKAAEALSALLQRKREGKEERGNPKQ